MTLQQLKKWMLKQLLIRQLEVVKLRLHRKRLRNVIEEQERRVDINTGVEEIRRKD